MQSLPKKRFGPRLVIPSIRWLAVLLGGVVLGAAATTSLMNRPSPGEAGNVAPATYTVKLGTIGRTLDVSAAASWPVEGVVRSPGSGIVTEVTAASGFLTAGEVLLRLDERPVVLVPGAVPAFRALAVGSVGRDVEALQRYLAGLGYAVGSDLSRFTSATATAVGEWQRKIGVASSGEVRLGDVVFVSALLLRAPLRWIGTVAVGTRLSAGDPMLEELGPLPQVKVEFGTSPPTQLTPPVEGDVRFPDGEHRPMSLDAFHAEAGRTWSLLAPRGSLCEGLACLKLVPAVGDTAVVVTFTLVPQTTGATVPVAAIQSDAGGNPFVKLGDGTRRTIAIRVVDGGFAVVDGIGAGETIVMP